MKIAVPNAILFVLDPSNGAVEIPEYVGLVSGTDSCVSVGTQADVDGETEVFIGRAAPADLPFAFEGSLQTPGGCIAIWTSEGSSLGHIDGLNQTTGFTIWVDHDKWPSRVVLTVHD